MNARALLALFATLAGPADHMVTPDEQVLYEKLATEMPAGETVLGSPFTGAQFSAIWSGHGVVIPHTSSNPGFIEADVRQAAAAGLTGFAVNWAGTGSPAQTLTSSHS